MEYVLVPGMSPVAAPGAVDAQERAGQRLASCVISDVERLLQEQGWPAGFAVGDEEARRTFATALARSVEKPLEEQLAKEEAKCLEAASNGFYSFLQEVADASCEVVLDEGRLLIRTCSEAACVLLLGVAPLSTEVVQARDLLSFIPNTETRERLLKYARGLAAGDATMEVREVAVSFNPEESLCASPLSGFSQETADIAHMQKTVHIHGFSAGSLGGSPRLFLVLKVSSRRFSKKSVTFDTPIDAPGIQEKITRARHSRSSEDLYRDSSNSFDLDKLRSVSFGISEAATDLSFALSATTAGDYLRSRCTSVEEREWTDASTQTDLAAADGGGGGRLGSKGSVGGRPPLAPNRLVSEDPQPSHMSLRAARDMMRLVSSASDVRGGDVRRESVCCIDGAELARTLALPVDSRRRPSGDGRRDSSQSSGGQSFGMAETMHELEELRRRDDKRRRKELKKQLKRAQKMARSPSPAVVRNYANEIPADRLLALFPLLHIPEFYMHAALP
eukprot:TRINITY_DN59087_c0_g1_i1.p1 TRINITY_DN59087_c0_g1~~TRINITY_DN59087_c0_g1_i1.p1  ORF type:complete len:505 (+),score=127.69 TRINITY_DN59087_c0_g1_i1:28-1542(+)